MSVTPNMQLDVPDVSTTLGPEWARKINLALGTNGAGIDGHNHTAGKGVPIPSAGIAVDAELEFNGFDATLLRSTRYSEQAAALEETTDLGCVYNVGGDLYWNNGDGTAVQITDGATLAATSLGGISGLPSGTASVAFATSTYTFRRATNSAAIMDVGPLVIRDTAASALGITLASPVGLAGAYSLTLPPALPASSKIVQIGSDGQISAALAPDGSSLEIATNTLQVKALGVTKAMQAAVGQQLSASVSTSTTSTSMTNVTGMTVSITTSGRPIIIAAITDDTSGVRGYWELSRVSGTLVGPLGLLQIVVSGSATATIGRTQFGEAETITTAAGTRTNRYPPATLWHLYAPAAGTYTFQVQWQAGAVATTTFSAVSMKLLAYEL